MAEVIAMVENAITSTEEVTPFKLVNMIFDHVEQGLRLARSEADNSAEDEVVEEIKAYAEKPEEYEVTGFSGNIIAILRRAFNKEWSGEPLTPRTGI
ncbi:hypothetical protein [Rhizobium leguminosarum]|uniref:hypothetical protein n=1 Tax=Rhizobium leguminosarum TaxID=384 RepID=UPI001031DF50|nr:hypothetical protein [Rhizobium leguminosarum]TAY66484.1 hypothetical protein ELH82_09915 [Rhizobium leguminosarum]